MYSITMLKKNKIFSHIRYSSPITPRYIWNTDKVGVKHQPINLLQYYDVNYISVWHHLIINYKLHYYRIFFFIKILLKFVPCFGPPTTTLNTTAVTSYSACIGSVVPSIILDKDYPGFLIMDTTSVRMGTSLSSLCFSNTTHFRSSKYIKFSIVLLLISCRCVKVLLWSIFSFRNSLPKFM